MPHLFCLLKPPSLLRRTNGGARKGHCILVLDCLRACPRCGKAIHPYLAEYLEFTPCGFP